MLPPSTKLDRRTTRVATEQRLDPVTFEGASITYRNFSGLEGRFNAKGNRNFTLILGEEAARAMEADGWNIRWQKPYEEGDPERPILEVSLKYRTRDGAELRRPPRVVLITGRGKTPLDEDMVSLLDWAEITNVDLIINPSYWEVQGRSGIKAYVQSLYVTIREDPLELKYQDVPDSASSSLVRRPTPESADE